ncbi:MAG: hypothetical protein LBI72_12520 [Flavobacteriaceae bacterium]|jgi:hypothetical protein|nr:hypothetical protein [Flavobacteriaceae bacterium]
MSLVDFIFSFFTDSQKSNSHIYKGKTGDYIKDGPASSGRKGRTQSYIPNSKK